MRDPSLVQAISADIVVFLASMTCAWAQCDARYVRGSVEESYEFFGGTIALEGQTLVVSSSGYDEVNQDDCGLVYFFEYGTAGWQEVASFPPPNGACEALFGTALAVYGDIALVAAPASDFAGMSRSGSVVVYRRVDAGWYFVRQIRASDAVDGATFGDSLDFDGNRAIVGTNHLSAAQPDKAYVLERVGQQWIETAILTAEPNAFGYGAPVAIDGSTVLVGEPAGSGGQGRVHVYEEDASGWTRVATLTGDPSTNPEAFGSVVDLQGDRAVIGDPGADAGTHEDEGAVYVFERSAGNWIHVARLTASDAFVFDNFGNSVALDGDLLLIGAMLANDPQYDSGSAYLFEFRNGAWSEVAEVRDPAKDSQDRSGTDVALSGKRIVVSRPRDDQAGLVNVGEIFFTVHGGGAESSCASALNSTGQAATIHHAGSLSVETNDLSLVATHLPPDQFGIFFYGAQPTRLPFGDGYRCLDGQVFRFAAQSTTQGTTTRAVDLYDPPQEAGRVQPGSTWYYQFSFRDPAAGGAGWNLSDLLGLTFCF